MLVPAIGCPEASVTTPLSQRLMKQGNRLHKRRFFIRVPFSHPCPCHRTPVAEYMALVFNAPLMRPLSPDIISIGSSSIPGSPVPSTPPPLPANAKGKGKAKEADVISLDGEEMEGVEEEGDLEDLLLVEVFDVIPDVSPDHARGLIQHQRFVGGDKLTIVQRVLDKLFEDPNYPRLAPPPKRKRAEENGEACAGVSKIRKVDDAQNQNEGGSNGEKKDVEYYSTDRPHPKGKHYIDLALSQLLTDFPFIPKPHVRETLMRCRHFYAPTHLALLAEQKLPRLPYKLKASKTKVSGKAVADDPDFTKEREWLLKHLGLGPSAEVAEAPPVAHPEKAVDESVDGGIDCGCCFTGYSFVSHFSATVNGSLN